jgi:UDP-N-acetylmuramoyl-tripeptide--D-alanyl-D-alanine ligase
MQNVIPQLYNLFIKNPVVCTDTRNITPGAIFFALKGESFNGNAFAQKAIDGGCIYAVIDEPQYAQGPNFIVVENALKTLQLLAREHRRHFNIPVVAITGSNGKTTTKELFNAVLSKKFDVLATQGNYNNEIGVPLTLLGLHKNHDIAIIEMGARKQGDIKELVEIAEPTHGLITNVGKAHLETMGGLEGVIKTKTELYKYLDEEGGVTFIRYEDAKLMELAPELKKFTYGCKEEANVVGKLLEEMPNVVFRWKLSIENKFGNDITSPMMGGYNFQNILAAIAAGVHFKVPAAQINEAIEEYAPTNNRSQVIKTERNTLYMDAYNANPTSMEGALRNFAKLPVDNKVLILGEMLEVGDLSEAEHEYALQIAASLNMTEVYVVGPEFLKVTNNQRAFNTVDDLKAHLKNQHLTGKTILVKGSRKNKLEEVVEVL